MAKHQNWDAWDNYDDDQGFGIADSSGGQHRGCLSSLVTLIGGYMLMDFLWDILWGE